ncbi:MAG: thermosome subunit alpha [Thermoprotei archaeon]|jgi:thermosome
MAEAASVSGIPVLILKEGTKRTIGREAHDVNIAAAKALAEALKTSLGPRGMDKMLVDSLGDITITGDGATILKEMEVQHPAAKMLVEVAKAQDSEVGDGTTTVVILAGELLKKAEELLAQNIHPTLIIDGYRKTMEYVLSELDKIAIKVNPEDIETLKKAAITSIYSKSLGEYREKIAEIAAKAILKVAEKEIDEKGNVKYKVDLDNIKIEKRKGKSIEETELIDGIVLDKEVVHPGMPKLIRNAKIAVINAPLEIEKPEMSAKINITSPEQMKAFLDEETKVLQKMVEKIAASGANVLVCQKGIDDVAQYLLKKKGIMAVRRVKESDMEKVAKATGARIITNIDDLSPKDLGEAGLVEERIVAEEKMLFIEQCKNPKAVTILVRGASELIIDEAERSLHDALSVCRNVLQTGKLVAGGGSTEIELAIRARDFANKLSGKEQLAAQKFAEALEIVPIILAETSGLEPIDALVELRALHAKGETAYGVDALKGKIDDMVKLNILDPMNVKAQAIKAATEAAIMILRIDDIIAASPKKEEKKEKEGEMGKGMGEYGGFD